MPRNEPKDDGLEDLRFVLAQRAAQVADDPADGILHQTLPEELDADLGDEPEEQLGEGAAEPEFAATELPENQPDGPECQDGCESATCAQAEEAATEVEPWTPDDERPMPPGFYLMSADGYVYCEGGEFWSGRRFEAQRKIERLKGHGHGPWAILEVVCEGFTW